MVDTKLCKLRDASGSFVLYFVSWYILRSTVLCELEFCVRCTIFDAQFHYVCYRYKPFARVVHFAIPGVHPLPRQPHPAGCFNWLYQCCVIDAVYVQPWLVWTFFFQVCMRAMFWCPCTVLVFYSVLQLLLYCNKWYQSYRVGYKTCLTSYNAWYPPNKSKLPPTQLLMPGTLSTTAVRWGSKQRGGAAWIPAHVPQYFEV